MGVLNSDTAIKKLSKEEQNWIKINPGTRKNLMSLRMIYAAAVQDSSTSALN